MKKILIPNYAYFVTAWIFIFISNYFIFLLVKQFGYNKYSVIFLLIDVAGFIVFAPFAFNYVIITDKCIKLKFKKHAISLLVTKKRINLIESICKVEITEFI